MKLLIKPGVKRLEIDHELLRVVMDTVQANLEVANSVYILASVLHLLF